MTFTVHLQRVRVGMSGSLRGSGHMSERTPRRRARRRQRRLALEPPSGARAGGGRRGGVGHGSARSPPGTATGASSSIQSGGLSAAGPAGSASVRERTRAMTQE